MNNPDVLCVGPENSTGAANISEIDDFDDGSDFDDSDADPNFCLPGQSSSESIWESDIDEMARQIERNLQEVVTDTEVNNSTTKESQAAQLGWYNVIPWLAV